MRELEFWWLIKIHEDGGGWGGGEEKKREGVLVFPNQKRVCVSPIRTMKPISRSNPSQADE